MRKVIDAHIHLSETPDDVLRHYSANNGLKYTLAELLDLMKSGGVTRGLLLSPPLKNGAPLPNEDILELCRRSGGVLSPVVTVEPSRQAVKAAVKMAKDHEDEVKAFKIRLGYIGVSALSPIFEEAYDFATAEGIPVLFHTGDTATSGASLAFSHPMTLDSLANKREDLTMVLCHFGNPWFEDTAEMVYKHPNVYADISGLTTGGGAYAREFEGWLANKLTEAVYFAGGAEKIIFGTDYPVTSYKVALSLVNRMEVHEADKELILWRNASRVFGL